MKRQIVAAIMLNLLEKLKQEGTNSWKIVVNPIIIMLDSTNIEMRDHHFELTFTHRYTELSDLSFFRMTYKIKCRILMKVKSSKLQTKLNLYIGWAE